MNNLEGLCAHRERPSKHVKEFLVCQLVWQDAVLFESA